MSDGRQVAEWWMGQNAILALLEYKRIPRRKNTGKHLPFELYLNPEGLSTLTAAQGSERPVCPGVTLAAEHCTPFLS